MPWPQSGHREPSSPWRGPTSRFQICSPPRGQPSVAPMFRDACPGPRVCVDVKLASASERSFSAPCGRGGTFPFLELKMFSHWRFKENDRRVDMYRKARSSVAPAGRPRNMVEAPSCSWRHGPGWRWPRPEAPALPPGEWAGTTPPRRGCRTLPARVPGEAGRAWGSAGDQGPLVFPADTPIEEFTPTPAFPALQYLESVDEGGVAWQAGLRTGDFLIEVGTRCLRLLVWGERRLSVGRGP